MVLELFGKMNNELKNKYGKIAIQIASKDRATEVGLLLESLRHQIRPFRQATK